WSGRFLVTADTSGSSFKRLFLPVWRANLVHTFLPRRWSVVPNWVSALMTGFFRIRILYQKEGLEILLLCLYKSRHDSWVIPFFSTSNLSRLRTSGRFWHRWGRSAGCRSRLWFARPKTRDELLEFRWRRRTRRMI